MTDELRVIEGGNAGAPNAVLRTLTMTGFKSFVNKTHLEFAPGITAIIGPNGSGKSNVADAIRWALGENNARILRAKRNEELIFAGSETRRGLGMAEALIQLDNSSRRLPIDFTEIEVGRRLFKNGEAEYLVNRSRVRLRDLQDLLAGAHLADNPFVVIGQGLVDQVLALRPADRRTVIEEAAGTRRLQLRREDALARLKSAEAELVRVIDILREIGPRVGLLTEQAAKWREYEVVRADLRRRALHWYRGSFGTTAAARADLVAKLAAADREIERLAEQVADSETITSSTDDELRAARQEEERRRIDAVDAVAAETSVRERVAALQASLEAIAAERDRARTALATLPSALATLRERRERVDEEAGQSARSARDAADAARVAEEDASRTRLALAEAQAARVAAERAHALAEAEERRLADELRALDAGDAGAYSDGLGLARRHVEALRELVSRLESELVALHRRPGDVPGSIGTLLAKLRAAADGAGGALAKLAADRITSDEQRRERLHAQRTTASAARATAAATAEEAQDEERRAAEAHAAASRRAEEARLSAATGEERRSSLVRLRDTLDEQVGATERRIADEEERVRALAAQERDSRGALDSTQVDLERAAAAARTAERSADLARERALAAEGSRRESEQRLAAARERLAELRGERSRLAAEEDRASGAMRLLEEQVRAELGIADDEPLPDPESLAVEDDEPAADPNALRDLQRLRRRLIALEPVNPLAESELAEIGERHSFLAAQRADLEKAIVDLRSLADELATTIAEQFSATLQAVDREFGLFFARLFNGGQASLRTSEDPDEPGIDILARPPGKRLGSLAQLSGGERALTATALLLAILRVKPAPFCVLDEVDAALDERNVGRFTQALRELTDRTQFIVVTHNRGTIEAADTLYGVSMDDGGVSKVISLKLAELDERHGVAAG